ncbi:phospholipid/cholesterol/gamma-HCH transport system substrate-binding protein [Rhodococcus sp. LBL1]|nr:phospholipid/cholesterol/gamma-HCH transport system substrate-binding protein [Rhodococcus sp. LBL1]MDH6682011.1 phospholipid/cholesterol/gamma-HCH transport system substrate-binding protein [Rhodococcus sp. LBL2]
MIYDSTGPSESTAAEDDDMNASAELTAQAAPIEVTETKDPGWRKWLVPGLVIALVAAVGLGAAVFLLPGLGKNTVYANFVSTTGLYEGDDVRVLGVKVGTVKKIEPGENDAKVTMYVDNDVRLPADAKAVIVAQNLVSSRFVQLTPVYSGGDEMSDGATISIDRTAVPVEWDEIKTELTKLSTALGPEGLDDQGSLARFIDTAGANLEGNGDALRRTLRQLSDTMHTLSEGRTDLFSTIRNLQAFVSALSSSNQQIVQFGGRLASVSDLLASSSDELGTALSDLNLAVGDVQRFVADNRDGLSESVQRLADATQVLADKRPEIERVLHAGPTSLANFYQIYKPKQGSLTGAIALSNFRNPVNWICGSIEAAATPTAERSADLCKQQLGPVLESMTMNYPPIMTNPAIGEFAQPGDVEFTEPGLQQAAAGGAPVSAVKSPLDAAPTATVPKDLTGLMQPGGGR